MGPTTSKTRLLGPRLTKRPHQLVHHALPKHTHQQITAHSHRDMISLPQSPTCELPQFERLQAAKDGRRCDSIAILRDVIASLTEKCSVMSRDSPSRLGGARLAPIHRVLNSSDRVLNSSDRVLNSSDRVLNSSDRVLNSSDRVLNSSDLGRFLTTDLLVQLFPSRTPLPMNRRPLRSFEHFIDRRRDTHNNSMLAAYLSR